MQNLEKLKFSLQSFDWFRDIGLNEWGVPTVYVNYMNSTVFQTVFEKSSGLTMDNPCIYFASTLSLDTSKYVLQIDKPQVSWEDGSEPDSDTEPGLPDLNLSEEVGKLRKVCGTNILSDIFYEVHDGKNAITNLSAKFPEIREALNNLYNLYGFDLVYEQVDS